MKKKIVILCVTYHSDEYLQKYRATIDKAAEKVADRAVVDVYVANNDTDNRGYFGGIQYLLSTHDTTDADFTIVSNVDILLSEDFFEKLLEIQFKPDVACIAPSIRSISEQQERNPEYIDRPTKRHLQLARMLYLHPLIIKTYEKLIYYRRPSKQTPTEPVDIFAAHGSIMIFTGQWAQKLVPDFKPFLYGEELFIAEQLRKQGQRTVFCPNLHVTDYDHVSTSTLPSRFFCKCNWEGLGFVLKNYE